MKEKIALSGEEIALLKKMNVEELRLLLELRENGKVFQVLLAITNMVIDTEKNYFFSLNEASMTSDELALKHAFSRGQAAFGTRLLRLITASGQELARREELQKEIRKKQGETHE